MSNTVYTSNNILSVKSLIGEISTGEGSNETTALCCVTHESSGTIYTCTIKRKSTEI